MKALGPCDIDLSRLNPTPHAIAVYASQPMSPVTTQHSLPSGRYSLLGPDSHRLDRTSLRLAHSFDHLIGAVKQKHATAARTLAEVYQEFEAKVVSALRMAHSVDAEVKQAMAAKPFLLDEASGDGRRLLTVECAARHLGVIDDAHSLMMMKIPAFHDASKYCWPPATPWIAVTVAGKFRIRGTTDRTA